MDRTGAYIRPRSWLPFSPIIAILAIAISYASTLADLFRDWARDPNYHHGFLIPLISGYLIWRNRAAFGASPASPSLFGLLGLFLSTGLLILGSAGAEVFTQRVSFVFLLGSVVLFLYGWRRLRIVAFPIALLLLAIPLPYVIYYGLTAPLQALAAKCAVWGLRAVGVQVLAQGNILHLPQASLEVAEACSGIRSLYAFLAVGALVAYFTPIPFWGRTIIFLTTIPLSVAGNAVRVWGSGLGAYLISPAFAEGFMHELFGLVIFIASMGVFILIKRAARKVCSSAR